jgi:hypothetical protein
MAFGASHLPFLYALAGNPPFGLVSAALAVNIAAAGAFGWLFWRAGLECAMIAHVLTHLVAAVALAVV